MSTSFQDRIDLFKKLFVDGSPHAADLGFKVLHLQDGIASLEIAYREDLVGDVNTGVIHGGVITALLDHASGAAGFTGLGADKALATLDLRIDYMRPATSGENVIADARTVKVAGLIAFVEASAHNGDPDDPIATAHAAFMVTQTRQTARDAVKEHVSNQEASGE